ncbi:MAG: sugar transferase [Carnobacterium sp.]|uniref:sugar transferase n=1 Tax=Carnobacterium sp. TaxID=48221 RepID=UPI003C71DED3
MFQGEKFSKTKKIIIAMVDIFLFHLAILFSFYIQFKDNIPDYNFIAYTSSFVYIMAVFVFLNILFGVYILYNKSLIDFLYITIIIQVIMTIAIMAVTFAGRWFTFPRSVLIYTLIVSTIFLFIWRAIVYKMYVKFNGTKKVMLVGTKDKVHSAFQNFAEAKNERHKVKMVIVGNYFENIKSHIDEIDIVYLASQMDEIEKIKIYELLIRKGKKIFLNTSFENIVMVNPNIMNIEDESIIEISDFKIPGEDDFIKRLVDIVFATILIIVTSPIMFITAILVKITSKGPAFYSQIRVTKDGKEFNILKFRSMAATAERDSGPVLASSSDARVTTIGRYLRALRIDELPQLFNVLKGEMSVVGPRPERPFFVNQFQEQNPAYYLRHNVRAGITGYAQVYGKYASDFNSKLNFDLIYIKKYSFFLDAKIMLQTIKILFDKVSSKGLEEDNVKEIPKEIMILD